MKKTICVVTATRAEYGLLKPIIKKLSLVPEFDVRVAVTGAHLSPEFGLTYREIEEDGIKIDEKVEMLLSADTPSAISKSMGLAMIGFADYFKQLKPDMLIVLGDRYETLAVAAAAMNQRIPIAHLYGGETTEGAIDDNIRHAVTKLSYLHFTSTEEYRRRVIQLGETPERVFCTGAVGIENIKNEKLMSKAELEGYLQLKLDKPYAVVTFHPVTLENDTSGKQIRALLDAISRFKDMIFIFTKANSDESGRWINQKIDEFTAGHTQAKAFASLGMVGYLSTLKYCAMVIGNSSSGIIEAPSFGIPTVNIGDRQKGRIRGDSIIDCDPDQDEIVNAMHTALRDDFKAIAKHAMNPYGDGDTSDKIVERIKEYILSNKIDLKKNFFDIG